MSFVDLSSAQEFFSNNVIDLGLLSGLNDIQIALDATMSGGEGFGFDYSTVSTTPLPSSWTMMLIGLAGIGFVAYSRKKETAAA